MSCRIEADCASSRTNVEEKEAFQNNKEQIGSFEKDKTPKFQTSRSPSKIFTLDQSVFGGVGKEVGERNIQLSASEFATGLHSLQNDRNLTLVPKDEAQIEQMTTPLFDARQEGISHDEQTKSDARLDTSAKQIMSPLKKDKNKSLDSEFPINEGASSVNLPVISMQTVSQSY